ncbi:YceD family protein [Belliella marina]|uniref:YceD family protein n=1 Tax=Belliella marina TaxID=1644146 RepID=A0ABW4VP02_9BACT
MKFLKNYNIDIIKLKEGKHEFTFAVDKEFFEHFEASEFLHGGTLQATVHLDKLTSLMEATFEIKGDVILTCDRSLEEFGFPLSTEAKIIYKYGIEEIEITDDVLMITRDTPSINVAQLIYEFILLAIPAKKIHPDYAEEMDEEDFEGDGELVYISNEISDGKFSDENETEDDSDENTDPRWEKLKNLKKKD